MYLINYLQNTIHRRDEKKVKKKYKF